MPLTNVNELIETDESCRSRFAFREVTFRKLILSTQEYRDLRNKRIRK
jgi:hypothetical protein